MHLRLLLSNCSDDDIDMKCAGGCGWVCVDD